MVKRATRLAKPPNMSVNQDNNLQKMKRSRCCGGGDGIIRAGGQRCSLAKVQLGNPGEIEGRPILIGKNFDHLIDREQPNIGVSING